MKNQLVCGVSLMFDSVSLPACVRLSALYLNSLSRCSRLCLFYVTVIPVEERHGADTLHLG